MMMAQRQQAAEQACASWDGDEQRGGSKHISEHARVAASLREAASLLESEPDVAAALLDGMIVRIGMLGLPERMRRPDPVYMLRALDARAPALARRLRLALLAPHVEARYGHAVACLRMLDQP